MSVPAAKASENVNEKERLEAEKRKKKQFEAQFASQAKTIIISTSKGNIRLFPEYIYGNILSEISKSNPDNAVLVQCFLEHILNTQPHPVFSPGLTIKGLELLTDDQFEMVCTIISSGRSFSTLTIQDMDFIKLGDNRTNLLINALHLRAKEHEIHKDRNLSKIDLSTCNVGDLPESDFLALCLVLENLPVKSINIAHKSLNKIYDEMLTGNNIRYKRYCKLIENFRGVEFTLSYDTLSYSAGIWNHLLRTSILNNKFLQNIGSMDVMQALSSGGRNDIMFHLIDNANKEALTFSNPLKPKGNGAASITAAASASAIATNGATAAVASTSTTASSIIATTATIVSSAQNAASADPKTANESVDECTDQELAAWITKIDAEYGQYSDKIIAAELDGSKVFDPKKLAEVVTNETHCKDILAKLNEYNNKVSSKGKSLQSPKK